MTDDELTFNSGWKSFWRSHGPLTYELTYRNSLRTYVYPQGFIKLLVDRQITSKRMFICVTSDPRLHSGT